MIEVRGQYDAKFEPMVERFLNNFTEKGDVGASYAVSLEGEMVVDIWAGHRDAQGAEPWQEDTIVNVYSTTKTMAAMCALVLADRGLIDFNAPVADYWPEFAQNGKAHIEVRHFMSHSAGLSGMDEPAQGDTPQSGTELVEESASLRIEGAGGDFTIDRSFGHRMCRMAHFLGSIDR